MDELNDLIEESQHVTDQLRMLAQGLEATMSAAEAILAKWFDEEGRLADREG